MILKKLSIVNYKNIETAELSFSDNMNCFVGNNGMGKTNLLDAVYFLSFCKSSSSVQDSLVVRHDAPYFMLQAEYADEVGTQEKITCSLQTGRRKSVKRNGKEYKRLTSHIGFIPLVMISPDDGVLVSGGSDERRRFANSVVSQYDINYLESVMRYEKALKQRNALMRQEEEPDWGVVDALEELMDADAEVICKARRDFVEQFRPYFHELYGKLGAQGSEQVDIQYQSHSERGSLLPILREGRQRERIVGYTLHGPHKDDLLFTMNGYPIRREGSQGQTKTFFISVKLAQFLYLKDKCKGRVPILLLDDIFDKLDANRVARIIDCVSKEDFGQIFITDTNRDNLDCILQTSHYDYRLFRVENGNFICDGTTQVAGAEK